MAVRAQDSEIFETVIMTISINMVEFKREIAVRSPFGPAALLAMLGFQLCVEQSLL